MSNRSTTDEMETAQIFAQYNKIMALIISLVRKIKENTFVSLVTAVYIVIILLTLNYGTPNSSHPFLYNMDEWHQLMAIKAIVKHGTTTIPGAAQIPFLFPVLSGIYLIPFVAFHIVNPFALKSPLDNLVMQQRLFEILRSVNLWFGIGSILLIAKIAKSYLRVNYLLPVCFFAMSPILLTLSGYFKYDVALLFWIVLSLLLLLRFGEKPSLKNYASASIACALALSTKFSAIPLLPLLILAYYVFAFDRKTQLQYIFLGLVIYSITFVLAGIPNALIGRADYRELLYSNLIASPQGTDNFLLPSPWWYYLTVENFPLIFGRPLYFLSGAAFLSLFFSLFTKRDWWKEANKNTVFLIAGLILFILSLVPLKIWASNNRVLVLLPFFSLLAAIFFAKLHANFRGKYRVLLSSVFVLLVVVQLLESAVWIYTKLRLDPQQQSSVWIAKHIPAGSTLGIESIPIYQNLPNSIVKEYYAEQYKLKQKNVYIYRVVDKKTKRMPPFIVITNDDIQMKLLKQSPKKDLVNLLTRDGYKKIAVFSPDLTYFHLLGTDVDYYLATLASPLTISIYKKS